MTVRIRLTAHTICSFNFNAITGGTQIDSTIARPNTALINGVFTVTLDFGATAFNNPNSVFIEIDVKPAGSPNAFTILGPRQQLTVVPFAVRAAAAANADNANLFSGLSSAAFIKNTLTPQPNSNINLSGDATIGRDILVFRNSDVRGNFIVRGFTQASTAINLS